MKLVIYKEKLISMLKKLSIYLIGLLPLALIAGPLIAEIFLFLLFIFFLYFLFKEKKFFLFDNRLFKVFLIFWFYLVTVSFFAPEKLVSLKSSFFYLRFGIYTISILYFLNSVKEHLNIIYLLYKFTLIFVIFDSFIQIFYGSDIFGLKPKSIDLMRISGPFGDKFVLGSFLQKILPVFIYFILKNYEKIKKLKWDDLVIIALSFVIIYRSGDRAALGLILLFSLIFFIIYKPLRKKILLVSLIFLVMSAIITFHNPKIFKRVFVDTIGQFKGQYYDKFLDKDISETKLNFMIFSFHHQSHFTTAFRMFLDKPIHGHGLKMFRYKCEKFAFRPEKKVNNSFGDSKEYYGCSTHPHNTYFQLLSEAGIIGFLTIFVIFLYIFYKVVCLIIKNKNPLNPKNALLIALFINLWPIIPTGNFFNNWLSMLYFIPISYYLFENKYNSLEKIV